MPLEKKLSLEVKNKFKRQILINGAIAASQRSSIEPKQEVLEDHQVAGWLKLLEENRMKECS